MTQLLLLLSLIPALQTAPVTTPSDDCLKTRACLAKTDYEICLYPRKCGAKAAVAAMPSQPCVWPNPCAKPEETVVLAQFQPCVWPNRCSGKRSETAQI